MSFTYTDSNQGRALTLAELVPVTTVDADGWRGTPATLSDLSLTPFNVRRAGFDSTGTFRAAACKVFA